MLIIYPMTGQKMCSWYGMVQLENLLEDLIQIMDVAQVQLYIINVKEEAQLRHNKKIQDETNEDEEMQRVVAASLENLPGSFNTSSDDSVLSTTDEKGSFFTKLTYPPLFEQPKSDKNLVCRIGVCLPDGRRAQRNFLLTDPILLLWSFCHSQLGEAESKPYCLTRPIPEASKSLDYNSKLTFK